MVFIKYTSQENRAFLHSDAVAEILLRCSIFVFSYGTEDCLFIGNPLGSCSFRTFARESLQGLFLKCP